MKYRKIQYLTSLCALLLLTACSESGASVQAGNLTASISSRQEKPIEAADQIYSSWQEAYASAVASIEKQIEDLSSYAQCLTKCSLYDLNEDGIDELVIVYPNGEDALSCALWTFSDEHLIQLADMNTATLAGFGAGGINVVQFEGEKYFCTWASNSSPWDEERGLWYYDCFLWPYPEDLDKTPYLFPQYTFEFRYFTGDGGSPIFSDAFSCIQNMAPLSFDQMISMKEIFLDHPLERLCDSYEPVGMTLDELSAHLA